MYDNPSFKIILIGDSGAGKTTLIKKYIHGTFKDQYEVTVGVDFNSKTVTIDDQPIQLQIWDTCGQDVYKSVTNSFYRGASAVFLVYAVNNKASFNNLRQWLTDFNEKGSKDAFLFLIGTKSDLEQEVESQEAFNFMKQIKGAFFIETSSKSDCKVQQLFQKAAQTMYKCYQGSQQFRELVKPDRNSMPINHASKRFSNLEEERQVRKTKRKCC